MGRSEEVFVMSEKKNLGRIEGDLLEAGRALRLRVTFRQEPEKGSEPENFREVRKDP